MASSTIRGWPRLVSFIGRFRGDLASIVVYAVAVGGLTLAPPVAAQVLINTIAFGTLLQPLIVLGALLAAALGLSACLQALQAWVAELLARKLFVSVAGETAHTLAHLAATPSEEPEARWRVNRFFEVVALEKALASLLFDGLAAVLQIFVGLVLLAVYHPILLAFDLLLLASLAVVLGLLGRRALRTAVAESSAKYEVAGVLEALALSPVAASAAAARQLACERVYTELEGWLQARAVHFRIVMRQMLALWGLQVASSVALLTVGGWLVIDGQLALGQLVAAELVMASTVGSLAKLGKQLPKFYDFTTSLLKLPQLTELPRERSGAESPPDGPVVLQVRHLGRAGEVAEPRERAVDLTLGAGARQGILGSAPERRRLFDLLTARSAAEGCVVRLGSTNVLELDGGQLRDRVRLVRKAELLPGTVYDNVRAGRPELGLSQAREALIRVGLDTFVDTLPEGGHSDLSTVRFALGFEERVLLALARAVAGQPRAVLIDGLLDPLSGAARERAIEALAGLPEGCALLVGTSDESLLLALESRLPGWNGAPGAPALASRAVPRQLTAGGSA